jgi:hypothetical protein
MAKLAEREGKNKWRKLQKELQKEGREAYWKERKQCVGRELRIGKKSCHGPLPIERGE